MDLVDQKISGLGIYSRNTRFSAAGKVQDREFFWIYVVKELGR